MSTLHVSANGNYGSSSDVGGTMLVNPGVLGHKITTLLTKPSQDILNE